MKQDSRATRIDVQAFAQAGATVEGEAQLASFPRLAADNLDGAEAPPVQWRATGSIRTTSGASAAWLHLDASAMVTQTCQRCLEPVRIPLAVDRDFRFVADEHTAETEYEDAEEDLLVASPDFDLRALVEDECLLELPLVPHHEVCPVDMPTAVEDPAFDAGGAREHPFAALSALRTPGKS